MSILKSIYKVRNRDSQTYDTLHPETEHSQVVDFGQGILSHLQSNVLASAISAMTSDSLFAKMMKLVLDASGVKYSMTQNGYICLGEFFGGLIIQWGLSGNDPGMGGGIFTYPLSCTPLIALANPSELGTNDLPNDAVITTTYNTSCVIDSTRTGYNGAYRVILIGNV